MKNNSDEIKLNNPVDTHEDVVPVRSLNLKPTMTIAQKHTEANKKQCADELELNN